MFIDILVGNTVAGFLTNYFVASLLNGNFQDSPHGSASAEAMTGPSLTLDSGIGGIQVRFNGTALGADGTGGFEGTVDDIELLNANGDVVATLILPFSTSLAQMAAAAAAGSGPVNYDNYTEFYDLLLASDSGYSLIYTGNSGNDVIEGFATGDSFNALGGRDTLILGDGSDTFNGGAGKDGVDGQAVTGLRVDLAAGTATHDGGTTSLTSVENATGGQGRDVLLGDEGGNTLKGLGGRDQLSGRGGNDKMKGGAGNDSMNGGNGRDRLDGGGGNDALVGGAGNDFVSGGKGADDLTGSLGADTFYFRKGFGSDTITDFDAAEDIIKIGKGAGRYGQLDIDQAGDDVTIAFANVTITVLNADVADFTRDVFDL